MKCSTLNLGPEVCLLPDNKVPRECVNTPGL